MSKSGRFLMRLAGPAEDRSGSFADARTVVRSPVMSIRAVIEVRHSC